MQAKFQAQQHSSAAIWALGLKGLQGYEKAERWEMEGPVSPHCKWDCWANIIHY